MVRQTSSALKALEADRRLQAEQERVSAERDLLAEEMARLADPIAQIAHTVSRIAICDREIGRLNATSTARFSHIPIVLSGAARLNSGSVSGRGGLGCFHGGRETAVPAGCFRRGTREGQVARQAISRFASGVLAEVERGSNSQQSSGDVATRAARLANDRR